MKSVWILALLVFSSCAPTHPPYVFDDRPSVNLVDQVASSPEVPDTLYLKGVVTGRTVGPLVSSLVIRANKPTTIVIDSPGGSVGAGLDLVKAIQNHGQVTCIVDGAAFSMASIILQSCQTRYMTSLSLLMNHPASVGGADGNAEQLRELAGELEAVTEALLVFACRRANDFQYCFEKSVKTFWIGPLTAYNLGLVDGIVE